MIEEKEKTWKRKEKLGPVKDVRYFSINNGCECGNDGITRPEYVNVIGVGIVPHCPFCGLEVRKVLKR